MHRVVVTEFMDEPALNDFGAGFDVMYAPTLVDDRAAMLAALSGADGVIVRNRTQVDTEFLQAAPQLRAVGRLGVGLDNIDLDACAARGVAVLPATGANAQAVAEYVISAALALTRTALWSTDAMIAGDWPRGTLGRGGEIAGKTIGLIGLGNIAQLVAKSARALGMDVIAHDPHLPASDPAWALARNTSMADLFAGADILSLHVPLTDETRNLIDAGAMEQMRPGAALINTARGGIVDERALSAALVSGKLGGAALDVFDQEPLSRDTASHFADVPNLILTPHIAGVTAEANTRVSTLTVANLRAALTQ